MADVDVTFGAKIDDLIEGVQGARESVESVQESITHLAELFGVAFSLEGLKSYIESMAELGTEIVRTSGALGTSNQQTVELRGVAQLAGSSLDSLALGIERMTLNIQRSTIDGTNPAAQALGVLHLRAQELIGLNAEQVFSKLTDAASKFNPSLNLTNALMQLGGRGAAQLASTLAVVGVSYTEFKARIDAASEGLAEAAPRMADTHEKIVLMQTSAESFGARIFTVLKPAIDAAIVAVTNWLQSMNEAKIRAFADEVLGDLQTAVVSVAAFFLGASITVDDFTKKLADSADQLKLYASIAAGALVGSVAAGPVGAVAGGVAGAITYETSGGGDSPASSFGDRFGAGAQGTVVAQINQFFQAIKSAIDNGNAEVKKGGGLLDAGQIHEGAAQALEAAKTQYDGQVKAAGAAYDRLKQLYGADVAQHKLTVDQETAALLAALNARWAAENDAIVKKLALDAVGSKGYQETLNQQAAAYNAFIKEHNALTENQVKKDSAEWQSVLNPVLSAWNSQLRSLLAGTETFGAAFKKIIGDLVIDAIEGFEKIAAEKAAAGLATALGGPQSALGGLLGGGSAAVATTANTTALTGLTAAVLANTAATTGSAATSAASSATSAVGGAGGLLSLLKLFLPGFAVGTDYIAAGGLAQLHAGEQIVPAKGTGPYTGASSGGDVHLHVNHNTLDSQTGYDFMMKQLPSFAKQLQSHMNQNPSTFSTQS